jgi:hypothetical protein
MKLDIVPKARVKTRLTNRINVVARALAYRVVGPTINHQSASIPVVLFGPPLSLFYFYWPRDLFREPFRGA